jgi:hypothetical protein
MQKHLLDLFRKFFILSHAVSILRIFFNCITCNFTNYTCGAKIINQYFAFIISIKFPLASSLNYVIKPANLTQNCMCSVRNRIYFYFFENKTAKVEYILELNEDDAINFFFN